MSNGQMTGKPLIESDRVEGTTVYDPSGNNIGSIKRLMIEKLSGRVAYAVMSFGGFLGMGTEEHAVPWNKLTYDTSLGGYRTDITEQQLRGAPAFSRDRNYDWTDRNRERELHDYYLGSTVLGNLRHIDGYQSSRRRAYNAWADLFGRSHRRYLIRFVAAWASLSSRGPQLGGRFNLPPVHHVRTRRKLTCDGAMRGRVCQQAR